MDLAEYLRVLRAHRVLIITCVVTCTAAAAVLAWTRTPLYTTQTQFFVSTKTLNPGDIYAGGLFSQQRVQSYAQLVTSPTVLQRVIAELTLPSNSAELASRIRVSVPENTVLIDVTVTDESRQQAREIAQALGRRFARFVGDLESQRTGKASPVKVSVTSPPQLPTSPASPEKRVYLILGALGGLFLGIVGAVLSDLYIRSRLPTPMSPGLAPRALPIARRHVGPGEPEFQRSPRRVSFAEEVSAIVDAPILGTVSEVNGRMPLTDDSHSSPRAGANRMLQANVAGVSTDRGLRSFVVTSAVLSEGKTAIAARLAAAFAEAGYRVILVDANFEHPTLTKSLGLSSNVGLADVLTDGVPIDTALHASQRGPGSNSNMRVLSIGQPRIDPRELFASERLPALLAALTNRADLVIVDGPALLASQDAQLLSGTASGAIVVARDGSTRVDQLEVAAQSLRVANASIVGIIVNQSATEYET